MCGRYRLTAKERYLRDHFGLDVGAKWLPRWNIAPTQMIPTIRQHPKEPARIFSLMRWGLIPYWAKDESIGLRTINATSETAAVKPVFRDAFKYRRCLIPADGFYEWKKSDRNRSRPTTLARSKVPFLPSQACGIVGVNLTTLCSKPARS
jgi:putative SOS response-associated peptidase YedK